MNKKKYIKKQYATLAVGFLATYGLAMLVWNLSHAVGMSLFALIPGYYFTMKLIVRARIARNRRMTEWFPAR